MYETYIGVTIDKVIGTHYIYIYGIFKIYDDLYQNKWDRVRSKS